MKISVTKIIFTILERNKVETQRKSNIPCSSACSALEKLTYLGQEKI